MSDAVMRRGIAKGRRWTRPAENTNMVQKDNPMLIYDRSPLNRRANAKSFGWIVTRLA
jgi:hypothetical protein